MTKDEPYAIVPGQIWNGYNSSCETAKAVIVDDDRIDRLISANGIPAGMKQHHLPCCTLLPGLIDCHVHLSDWMRPVFLAAGVTTIRDVGNNLEWILNRRSYAEKHPARSPRILCCGPLLDGPTAHWPLLGRAHADRQTIERSVQSVIARGVDAVKLYVNVTRDQMVGAVRCSHERGMHILAHLGAVTAEDAAEIGLDEIEHLSGCATAWKESTVEEVEAFCGTLASNPVITCPTLVVWDRIGRVTEPAFLNDRRLTWVHPSFREAWRYYPWRFDAPIKRLQLQRGVIDVKRCLGEMWKRDMPIICGTDTPFPYLVPGFSLHDELGLMVDAGLSPVGALRSATHDAASILRVGEELGGIEPGKIAVLVAVRGNPLVDIFDIQNIVQVVHNGNLIQKNAIRRQARRAHKKAIDDPVGNEILGYVSRMSAREEGE
ncbi:MAG: amidohydrolase family protein [Gemmatimonadota bacterium]|nr:amidohydrolase family protein [Gemmatimonadota bacterium]